MNVNHAKFQKKFEQFQGNYLKSILSANWTQQYGGPAAILDDGKIPLLSGDAWETTEKSESGFREEKSERMKPQKAVSEAHKKLEAKVSSTLPPGSRFGTNTRVSSAP